MESNGTKDIKIEHKEETEPDKEVKVNPIPIKVREKRNSKDEKSRKKDEKNVELMLKSLNDLDPEKKLNAFVKKYMEILDENRKLQTALKFSEKRLLVTQKERDQCESERSKAVLARSRLESLCRELQKQNKAIKEESLLKIKEEEEKRKDVSAKFKSALTEITDLMTETNDKNVRLHEDNMEIHRKFQAVFEEMDIREKHFEEMHKMMKQELLVTEGKLAQVTIEMSKEKEKMITEKNAMLIKLTEYQKKISELQGIEIALRSQVNMYTDKYAEFQNALTKSNEVFGGFNQEMEKMSKKILKLEKETIMWKTRCEKTRNALLDMATEKQTKDNECIQLNKKCILLQELCKTFQQERATLIAELKEKTKREENQNLSKSEINSDNSKVNGLVQPEEITQNQTEESTKDVKTETLCSESENKDNEYNGTSQELNENNSKSE